MSNPQIQVDDLKVIYNKGKSNEVRSLDGVSIRIYPQEYIIIYGPSGCGKSTLLYSISGLQAPTEGDVTISGKKISQMNKSEMVDLHQSVVGMIFQAFYLIPSLNIVDNVCLPKVFRGESKSIRREAGVKLLHRFSIVEQASKFPSQLSGGQKQRVSIARSLINNPNIILADEPVGNLDSDSAENVMNILKELNEVDKKTVILVTHNAEHLHFADRVIYMKDGKIIREEVNKEKRPEDAQKEEIEMKTEDLTYELKLLMRTFKNLSTSQIGSLLVPFKASQLLTHVLYDLNQEQIDVAGAFLKEVLFGNISVESLQKSIDMDYDKGGAGWNKQRAGSFAKRVEGVLGQVENLKGGQGGKAAASTVGYLVDTFKLKLDDETKKRFSSFIRMRIENKLDRFALQERLDASRILGGVSLHKNTAEKVSREMEIIMLLKYSQ
ncbi:MAG: transporter protein [Patescibacteria group bacterium]|nr:transporter protein [Patescibacteria group bacterium]